MRLRSGIRLSEIMGDVGLDTVSLAAKVGVSKQFIALLVAEKRGCRQGTAEAIAGAVDLPVSALFVGPMLSETPDKKMEVDVSTAVEDDDPYLFFPEVVKLTGIKGSTLRLYRFRGEGPPFFRQGKHLRCRRSRVLAWMRSFEPDDE
ncbi:hypothetical protein [Micrococcus luteus]|uniref:hypothetical protein n=1 Tax=Micrococcus luteus TaxID=1270 RepID=UPI0033187766